MRKLLFLSMFVFGFTLNLFAQAPGFVSAYDSMHQRFRVYYAFGEWKAVDWDGLNNRIRPGIVQAADRGKLWVCPHRAG